MAIERDAVKWALRKELNEILKKIDECYEALRPDVKDPEISSEMGGLLEAHDIVEQRLLELDEVSEEPKLPEGNSFEVTINPEAPVFGPKLVQLVLSPGDEDNFDALYAQCDDGSIWMLVVGQDKSWTRLPAICQEIEAMGGDRS